MLGWLFWHISGCSKSRAALLGQNVGTPHGSGRAGLDSPGPTHCPSPEQLGPPGRSQSWALGTSLALWMSEAGMWASGWAQLCGTPGWEGQGCGELEAGPSAGLLEQRLVAPGGWHGVPSHQQVEGPWRGLGRGRQGWGCHTTGLGDSTQVVDCVKMTRVVV